MILNPNLLNPLPLHNGKSDWYDEKKTYHGACAGVLLPKGVIPAMQLTFHGEAPAVSIETTVIVGEEGMMTPYSGYMYDSGIMELSEWNGDWPVHRMYLLPSDNDTYTVWYDAAQCDVRHGSFEEGYTYDKYLAHDELESGFYVVRNAVGIAVGGMHPVFNVHAGVQYFLTPCGGETPIEPTANFDVHIYSVPSEYNTHERKYFAVIPRMEIEAEEGMYYLEVRFKSDGMDSVTYYSEPFKWVDNSDGHLLDIQYRRTAPLTDENNYMPFMDGKDELYGEMLLNAELMMPPYGFEEEVEDTDGVMFVRKRVSWVEKKCELLVTGYQAETLRGVWHCDKVTISQHGETKDVDYMPSPEISWDTDNHLAVATLTFRTDTVVQTNGIAEVYVEKSDDEEPFDETNWVKFTNLEESEITLTVKKNNSDAPTVRFLYTDGNGIEWPAESSTDGVTVTIPAGGVMYLRGVGNTRWSETTNLGATLEYKTNSILLSGKVAIEGDIDCLLDEDVSRITQETGGFAMLFAGQPVVDVSNMTLKFDGNGTMTAKYARLFYKCTDLVTTPIFKMGAVTNGDVLRETFYGCTNLINIQPLNITAVARVCMSTFYGCTSLVDASMCTIRLYESHEKVCQSMFQGCTSLVNAPSLPATSVAGSVYQSMFQGCTSLVNAPSLPATSVAGSAYQSMFQGCTSLVNAPAIAATSFTTSGRSLQSMFQDCTSLVNVPTFGTTNTITTTANTCINMFRGCTSLEDASSLKLVSRFPTAANEEFSGMFYGCTKLKKAPEILSTSMRDVYTQMFYNCSSLTEVAFTTMGNSHQVVYGCSSLSIFTCKADTPPTITATTLQGMPNSTAIKVPAASVEAYKAAANWSARAGQIVSI